MPSKRFLMTSAPFFVLALAGVGLAAAQSSSPFAVKKRAQAWEQQPAVSRAPQSWGVPNARTAAPTSAQYEAPYQAPAQSAYSAPVQSASAQPSYAQPSFAPQAAIPASPDAPIATRPQRKPVMQAYSANTPPKTFGGRSAQQSRPAPQSLAGAVPPPARRAPVNQYAQAQYAQASGAPVPPTGQGQAAPPPTRSPFAPRSSARPQAWETPQPAQAPQGSAYQPQPSQNQGFQSPAYQSPRYQSQGYQPGTYQPPAPQAPSYQNPSYQQGQTYGAPSSTPPVGNAPNRQAPNGYTAPNGYAQGGYSPNGYTQGGPQSAPPTGAPYPGGPFGNAPQRKRSWTEKLGLKNIATLLRGKLILGGAATYRDVDEGQLGPDDGWTDSEIADAELEFEASAITDGGLEYGLALGARAQYDEFRRGFGGQLPDCPPGIDGCSGSVTGLRGHTSGFYSGGEDITKDGQIALETAHLFLRSAYGDVTLGRDDGAAYLFSLGAPSLLAVGASNSPVDYTGFDSVKTVNDASGFGEKITYTSPRLLGDQIGFGVQLGASYALDGDVCGVDYCNGRNIDGILQPEIEDIFEVGLALDRTFDNGLRAELTGTYANGSEQTGGAEFDDLESYGAGLEFEYGKWTLGGSYLNSNNGLADGDYTAYDVGLTWQPSALGFTLGYGHAEDDNVGLESDQAVFGITYDFKKFTLGTGVQYVDRSVSGIENGLPATLDQKAASVFVQGGFKF